MPKRPFSSLLVLALLIFGAGSSPVLAQDTQQALEAAQARDLAAAIQAERAARRTVLKEVRHIDPQDALPLLEVLDVEAAVRSELGIPPIGVAGVVTAFVVLSLVLSRILFALHIRRRPF